MLAEPKLKFARAFELAQTMESADRDTRKLQYNTSVHLLTDKSTTTKPCYRCGERHHPSSCRFVDAICHACKKTGRISKVCRSKQKTTAAGGNTTKTGGTKSNTSTSASQSSKSSTQSEPKAALTLTATPEVDVYTMFSIHGPGHAPFYVTLTVDGNELQMELDTGAAVSVMSEATYKAVWNVENLPPLQPSQVYLHMYTGDTIPVLGMMHVSVQHNQQARQLPLLLGRD